MRSYQAGISRTEKRSRRGNALIGTPETGIIDSNPIKIAVRPNVLLDRFEEDSVSNPPDRNRLARQTVLLGQTNGLGTAINENPRVHTRSIYTRLPSCQPAPLTISEAPTHRRTARSACRGVPGTHRFPALGPYGRACRPQSYGLRNTAPVALSTDAPNPCQSKGLSRHNS